MDAGQSKHEELFVQSFGVADLVAVDFFAGILLQRPPVFQLDEEVGRTSHQYISYLKVPGSMHLVFWSSFSPHWCTRVLRKGFNIGRLSMSKPFWSTMHFNFELFPPLY